MILFSTEYEEVELFILFRSLVGTNGLSEPNILASLGLTEPSVPEEPAVSWVPCWRPMGVEMDGVTSNVHFFEVGSLPGELGVRSLEILLRNAARRCHK